MKRKVVFEIPLDERVRSGELGALVDQYRIAIEGALRACKMGEQLVHEPGGIRAYVMHDSRNAKRSTVS